MKGGIYELIMIILIILVASVIWVALGWGLGQVKTTMEGIVPNQTAFNQTPMSDTKEVLEWPMTAFTSFMFFVALVGIVWAVKKSQVNEYGQ